MTPFFMAWGMFFSVPCPIRVWDKRKYKEMLLCMPLIGLLIGLINTGIFFLCRLLFGSNTESLVTAAFLFITPWLASGFIHLDGFMDCADAFLSRRDLEERRRILKDSRVGAFAVITLVILSILSLAVSRQINLEGREWLLLFIPAVSRACSAFFVLALRPLPGSSYEGIHQHRIAPLYHILALVCLTILICAALITAGTGALCLLVEISAFMLTVLILYRNLGGMSGDISGSCITICEFTALAALLF